MSESAPEPTSKQIVAIDRLVIGESVICAANAAGVSPRQLHRWLANDPVFVRALRESRESLVKYADAKRKAKADEAIEVAFVNLKRLAEDKEHPQVAYQASLAIDERFGGFVASGDGDTGQLTAPRVFLRRIGSGSGS